MGELSVDTAAELSTTSFAHIYCHTGLCLCQQCLTSGLDTNTFEEPFIERPAFDHNILSHCVPYISSMLDSYMENAAQRASIIPSGRLSKMFRDDQCKKRFDQMIAYAAFWMSSINRYVLLDMKHYHEWFARPLLIFRNDRVARYVYMSLFKVGCSPGLFEVALNNEWVTMYNPLWGDRFRAAKNRLARLFATLRLLSRQLLRSNNTDGQTNRTRVVAHLVVLQAFKSLLPRQDSVVSVRQFERIVDVMARGVDDELGGNGLLVQALIRKGDVPGLRTRFAEVVDHDKLVRMDGKPIRNPVTGTTTSNAVSVIGGVEHNLHRLSSSSFYTLLSNNWLHCGSI